MTEPALIAVDWGSTNRRVFALGADGALLWREADDKGAVGLPGAVFEREVDTLTERAGGAPVLMAGMVGSDRGWREAKYVPCPAGLDDLVAATIHPRPGVGIVPGASVTAPRADVMRGEEVQMLGSVAAGLLPPDGLACHPGTHAKWVRLEGGRIAGFRTSMTGELFGHLSRGGVLSAMVAAGDPALDAPFRDGVAYSLENDDLVRELFHARARVLLGQAGQETVAAYVSGLLIGEELRVNLRDSDGPVPLVGAPGIAARYAVALEIAGRPTHVVDGERAFLQGMRAVAEKMR